MGGLTKAAAVLVLALSAQGDSAPTMSCYTAGRDFHCRSYGASGLSLLPLWVLHTKPSYRAFVEEPNEFVGPAPHAWTYITVNFFLDDGSTIQSCAEVSLRDGRAKFRECVKKDK